MLAKKVVDAVESVIGQGPHKLHEPYFGGNERLYTQDVIDQGHVAAGVWTERFERELCAFLGAKHCVAVSSGTAALQAAYTLLFRPGERVTLPALTFIATANALKFVGCEPYFMDYADKAQVAVPILGHPVPSLGFQDASQALGSRIGGKYIGSSGTATFSFNQNKIISTGGGGAIVTDDSALYVKLKHLCTTARIPSRWEVAHDEIGYNFRMPNLNAAMGCAQLESLPKILDAKLALLSRYKEAFDGIKGVGLWLEPYQGQSNNWLVALCFSTHDDQQMALWALHNKGIQARMLPTPLHKLHMYAQNQVNRNELKVTETLWQHVICLPSSPKLGMAL